MVQLSLLSLVVPVLTETSGCLETTKYDDWPKVADLAPLSNNKCETRYADPADMTRIFDGKLGAFSNIFPKRSFTSKIGFKLTLVPVLAKTPKAVARSSIVTSPPPKVKDGPYFVGSTKVEMPNAAADATKSERPLITRALTAGINGLSDFVASAAAF